MECVIDNRESHLITVLKNSIPYTVKALDIGDISFYKDGVLVMVIERKSVSDLESSIKDGRHREQKARLMASGLPLGRIIYLIEGVVKKNITTLYGAMINTMFRDGLRVFKTVSIAETAIFIQRLYTKLDTESEILLKDDSLVQGAMRVEMTPLEYSATLKVKKKDNLTPLVWYIHQLASIPRVSSRIAGEISKVYPTFPLLMEAYRSQTDDISREKLLSEIKVKTTTGKTTRIGDSISRNVYMFVFGLPLASPSIKDDSSTNSVSNSPKHVPVNTRLLKKVDDSVQEVAKPPRLLKRH